MIQTSNLKLHLVLLHVVVGSEMWLSSYLSNVSFALGRMLAVSRLAFYLVVVVYQLHSHVMPVTKDYRSPKLGMWSSLKVILHAC